MNFGGEPDAGNLPVRFDGGAVVTRVDRAPPHYPTARGGRGAPDLRGTLKASPDESKAGRFLLSGKMQACPDSSGW